MPTYATDGDNRYIKIEKSAIEIRFMFLKYQYLHISTLLKVIMTLNFDQFT